MHDRLKAEGLFEPGRKRPLPRYPRRVVVVTSPTGAAVRDFLQTIGRRWPAAEVLVAPAKMQGIGSAEEVVEAIGAANRVEGAELIALIRGGGSVEDLWTFNEEIVARAMFGSALPIVTGIGHETDVTIADLVADARGLTPTDAAGLAVPDQGEVSAAVEALADRLARGLSRGADRARTKLDRASDRLGASAMALLARAGRRLDPLGDRLARAWSRDLERRGESLAGLAGRLEALSPLGVLARGYSLTLADGGKRVVRDAATLGPGDEIETRLAAGRVVSRVERVETEGGAAASPAPKRRRKK
jgi:exodeoxyribonuclease VII large subunit